MDKNGAVNDLMELALAWSQRPGPNNLGAALYKALNEAEARGRKAEQMEIASRIEYEWEGGSASAAASFIRSLTNSEKD